MYIPGSNRIHDIKTMVAFMQTNNFAIVVSTEGGIPIATHLPLTITQQGENILLRGHFARANQQWQTLADQETLVIFSGPHAYISPSHYDAHESVPTWNYVAVHAYGKAELIHPGDQPERLDALLTELISASEAAYLDQWQSLSAHYKDGMKQGIIGVEMIVTWLEGKAKISQNKSNIEQERIAHTLISSETSHIAEIGYIMQHGMTSK